MTSKILSQVICVATSAMLTGMVLAQDQSQRPNGQQSQGKRDPQSGSSQSGQAGSGATRDAPVAGVMPLGIKVEETGVILQGWRASKLIGASVYNDQDQKIGKIEEMIVGPDGKVAAAIVEVGGFIGLGKHRVAIPTEQFTDIKAKKLVLPNASKEALKALPEFKYV